MAGAILAGAPGVEAARPPYLDAWIARYPTSTLPDRMISSLGRPCYVCHLPSGLGDDGTCYRLDIRDRLLLGMTIEQALEAVEGLDSDGDGASNLREIMAVRIDNPAERGYHPGLVGPMGATPCGPSPGLAITGVRETPCFADCDTSTGAGVLDIFDFLCFQNLFAAGSPEACDCDTSTGVGLCDIFDFLCFQNAFSGGCP